MDIQQILKKKFRKDTPYILSLSNGIMNINWGNNEPKKVAVCIFNNDKSTRIVYGNGVAFSRDLLGYEE